VSQSCQVDEPAEYRTVAVSFFTGGINHAGFGADVGIGIHVDDIEDSVAETDIKSYIVSAAGLNKES